MEMKRINYMLDRHFMKFLTQIVGCPEGCFLRVWVSKKTPRCPAGQYHDDDKDNNFNNNDDYNKKKL